MKEEKGSLASRLAENYIIAPGISTRNEQMNFKSPLNNLPCFGGRGQNVAYCHNTKIGVVKGAIAVLGPLII